MDFSFPILLFFLLLNSPGIADREHREEKCLISSVLSVFYGGKKIFLSLSACGFLFMHSDLFF